MDKDILLKRLDEIGCFEIREQPVTLKSGRTSHFYIDLRRTFGYPDVLNQIGKIISNNYIFSKTFLKDTCVCGLPYAAMPLATVISQQSGMGLIVLRKEQKKHGTKNMIEGMKDSYKNVIIIDDVMTSGISILEGIDILKNYFKYIHVFVVINRGEELHPSLKNTLVNYIYPGYGGVDPLIHTLFTIDDLPKKYVNVDKPKPPPHPIISKLSKISKEKKSCLIVAIDEPDPIKATWLISEVADSVVCIKLHYDILDFSSGCITPIEWMKNLHKLSRSKNFLIFEDRKFLDIGNTVYEQYKQLYRLYLDKIDITNTFVLGGEDTVKSMKQLNTPDTVLLLMAEMSSSHNLLSDENIIKCIDVANANTDFVGGFICQSKKRILNIAQCSGREVPLNLLFITPGVNLTSSKDTQGQNYRSVDDAINRDECDFIIVGRGICNTTDPRKVAEEYRKEGEMALLK